MSSSNDLYFIQKTTLQGIAEAIKEKKGTTDAIAVSSFEEEIRSLTISSGAGDASVFAPSVNLLGTWYMNAAIETPTWTSAYVRFTDGGDTAYIGMSYTNSKLYYTLTGGTSVLVYENGAWKATQYKRITTTVWDGTESAQTTFLEWLNDSASKRGYIVTFMSNNATYSVVSITEGQSVNAPTPPTLTGFSFRGWYASETSTNTITFPYQPTADTTLYARYSEEFVIGVVDLTGGTSGALTLTDDGASVGTYTTSTSGDYVSVTNPLDSYFPFNQISEFTDASGNVFVKFPKLWMKWVLDSDGCINGYKFANAKADNDYFIPDAFLDPRDSTGATYLDYFALGKYEASGSTTKMYSKSGQTCLVSVTRDQCRIAARAYGANSNHYNGYQQLDMAQYTLYNLLCMMYYQTANIQTVYAGRTSHSNATTTGSCNGVTGKNGWNTSTGCVKMLGIENPYGNIFKWVDGIYFNSSAIYIHRFPYQFADSSTNATSIGFSRPTSSGYISRLKKGTTDAMRSYVYASSASGTESTYYGDYYWYSSSGTVLRVGGRWDYGSNAGLWCLDGRNGAPSSASGIGARLSYRPL